MAYRKLDNRTIDALNELFDSIDELDGDMAVRFCGEMWMRGLDIHYHEMDKYYYVGTGAISSRLNSAQVGAEELYEFCEQFDDQDKAYEIIKFVREANPLEVHIKRYG